MRRRNRAVLENLLCVLLLAVLPVVAFWPAAVRGELPLDLQSILFLPPWEDARPTGLELSQDPQARLQAQRLFPELQYINEAGNSLLWNPKEALGTPFLALWRTRVLSPFTLPVHFIPLLPGIALSVILKLAVAGWCAFYVARRFGFPPAMALLVAVPYQLSGPIYLWSGMPMSDVLPWLPLLLLCAERLAVGQTRAWTAAAVTIGLMTLGGDPETLIACLLFALLYLLGRRLRDPHNVQLTQGMGAFLAAAAIGLGLAGVQLVPYAEYLTQAGPPAGAAPHEITLSSFTGALMPSLTNPQDGGFSSATRLLHPGLVQLLLIALWIAARQFVTKQLRRRMESLLFAAVTLAIFSVLPPGLLQAVPFLSEFGPQHAFIAVPLAVAFLAAAAAEEWNELDPEQCKAVLARLTFVLPLVWGLGVAALIAAISTIDAQTIAIWPGIGLLAMVSLGLVVLLGFTLLRPSLRVTGYFLSALSAIALLAMFAPHTPRTPRDQIFPETAMLKSLETMQTRIAGSSALALWPLPVNGISTVFNPSGAAVERYQAFMARTSQDPLLQRRTGAEAFLLMKEDIKQGPFAAVRPVLNIQEVYPSGALLLRDLGAQPRARLIYAGRRAESFSPDLLTSAALPLIEGATLAESDSGPVAEARIMEESGTHVQVTVGETRPGLLVLADTWYPGWKASVDGTAADVVPVDVVLRGVPVPAGQPTVVFSYDPMSLKIGIAVSLVALLIVAINLRQIIPQLRKA